MGRQDSQERMCKGGWGGKVERGRKASRGGSKHREGGGGGVGRRGGRGRGRATERVEVRALKGGWVQGRYMAKGGLTEGFIFIQLLIA